MTIYILIALKTIFYMWLVGVNYNFLPILVLTVGISGSIISIIKYFKPKREKLYISIFYSIFSLILFVDMMYYGYFGSLPSIDLLGQVGQLYSVTDNIKMLLSPKTLIFIMDLPIYIYLVHKKDFDYQLEFINRQKEKNKNIVLWTNLGLVFLVLLASANTDRMISLKNQELFSYHINDIFGSKSSSVEAVGENQKEQVARLIKDKREELNKEDKAYYGLGKGKNLIVIQIESFQNFVINLKYNNQEITPNLNALIKDQGSLYFDEYYQLVGRGNTSDAEFVTNNSLHPAMGEYTYSQYADNTFYGLPLRLKDQGYTSWAYHGFEKEFWNRENAYKNIGFTRFLSEEDFEFEETIGFGIRDEDFLKQTLEYMKEQDSLDENPFYSFIITLSSHTPYTIQEEYRQLELLPEHEGNIVGDYLQSVRYTDEQLGIFLEDLKEAGLYENSVIAMYGDHFGINNGDKSVFEPMEYILGEPYNFDHIMNIPLIIHIPGMEENKTISKIGSQIDFYPTIMNIMGLDYEKGIIFGKDILNYEGYNYVAPQTILRKGSFMDGDILYNMSADGIFSHGSLFDRKTRQSIDLKGEMETKVKELHEKALNEINLSDYILKNNWMKEVLNGVDIDQIELKEKKEIPFQNRIKYFEEFDLEKVEDQYGKSASIIRLDLDNEKNDFDEISKWLDKKDAYIMLNSKKDIENLELIRDTYPDLMGKYIAEVYDLNQYHYLQKNAYDHILLNTIGMDYTDEDIINFLDVREFDGVILGKRDKAVVLINDLKEKNKKVYIEDENGNLIEK